MNKMRFVFFVVLSVFGYSNLASAQIDMTNFEEPKIYLDFANATVDEAQKLIQGYDINQKHLCSSLLMYAITDVAQNPSDTSVEKIKLLIDSGADVNQDVCGLMPLHAATGLARASIILINEMVFPLQEKIKKGVGYCPHLGKQCKEATAEDMKALNKVFGDLYESAQKNVDIYAVKVMEILISSGADVDKGNLRDKQSPLFMAATVKNSLDPLKTLIEHGADVNHQADNGYTALHAAAAAKNTRAIKMLLDAGADPNIRNHMGQTYLELDENSPVNQVILHSSDRAYFSM